MANGIARAVLSDVTAHKEYGVTRDFIVRAVNKELQKPGGN